jgi:hypothetical protein
VNFKSYRGIGAMSFLLVSLIVLNVGCSNAVTKCKADKDCETNFVCYPDGKCTEQIVITTDTLNVAVVATNYSTQMAATGGRGDYTWSLEIPSESTEKLNWLDIDQTTGLLRNKTGAQPKEGQISNDAKFTVIVTDSSETNVEKRTYTMVIVICTGNSKPCYNATNQGCYIGTQICNNGTLEPGCNQQSKSNDPAHCSTDCSQCDIVAFDGCKNSICVCGGVECNLQNVVTKKCVNGACDYEGCVQNHLDCNSTRTDGCEFTVDDNNCGCPNPSQIVCATDNKKCLFENGSYVCGCEDASTDCDSGNICCGNRCVDKSKNPNCGSCGNDCSTTLVKPYDTACISINSIYNCGCNPDNTGCGGDKDTCCGNKCVSLKDPNSQTNCGACTVKCGDNDSCTGDGSCSCTNSQFCPVHSSAINCVLYSTMPASYVCKCGTTGSKVCAVNKWCCPKKGSSGNYTCCATAVCDEPCSDP